jgi:hypothetical protein
LISNLRDRVRTTTDIWSYCLNNGRYTASSYYHFLFQGVNADPIFKKLWKSKSLPKLNFFAWLMLVDRLNTRDMMLRRQWHLDSGSEFVLCNSNSLECRDHLFFRCNFAQRCWNKVGVTWTQNDRISDSFMNAKNSFSGPCFMEIVVCSAWNIWKERNGFIFEQRRPNFARWRVAVKKDLLLTSHRLKPQKKESLLAWVESF